MHLCADECITVSIDTRTGRILLRDTGGLAAAGRAPSYSIFTEKINDNPFAVYEFLVMARFNVSVFPNAVGVTMVLIPFIGYCGSRRTEGSIYGANYVPQP